MGLISPAKAPFCTKVGAVGTVFLFDWLGMMFGGLLITILGICWGTYWGVEGRLASTGCLIG